MLEIVAIILILLGIALVILGLLERNEEYELKEEIPKKKVKGGGVILIGPFPIIIGDPRFALVILAIIVTLLLIWVVI